MDLSTPGVHVAYYVTTEGCIFSFDELIKSGFFIFFYLFFFCSLPESGYCVHIALSLASVLLLYPIRVM